MAKFILIVSAVIAFAFSLTCEATVYTVGDSAGWDISTDLPSWAENKTFYIGDALSFQYSSYHTVNEVDKSGYDSCRAANAVITGTNGNTTVPLTTAGTRYFICGVPSHCFGGMKLQVDVQRGNATSPSPSPSPQGIFRPDSGGSARNNDPSNPVSGNGSRLRSLFCTIGLILCTIVIYA